MDTWEELFIRGHSSKLLVLLCGMYIVHCTVYNTVAAAFLGGKEVEGKEEGKYQEKKGNKVKG